METLLTGLSTFAFISRCIVIFLQVLGNNLIPDHNANVFNPPSHLTNASILDSIIQFGLGGFRRWDAVYFSHIAEHGYSYENCLAFFPFYPMIVSLFSRLVLVLGVLQLSQCILLTSIMINCVLFALTAKNLYILSIETGFDAITSLLSVFVFCVNPASIFMTAPYSEISYFYFLILSLLYIERGLIFRASFTIAMSIAARSNGLVGIGFVLYSLVHRFTKECYIVCKETKHLPIFRIIIYTILKTTIKMLVCVAICISTFVMYQYFVYRQFCVASVNPIKSLSPDVISYGRDQGYKMVGDPLSSWCFQKLPVSYWYIQSKYWGVGFLQYYQIKQIPNFLLATPVVLLSFYACSFFVKMNKEAFFKFGLFRPVAVERRDNRVYAHQQKDNISDSLEEKMSLLAWRMVVYTFHLAFLTLFGCGFVHIQVLTRLLFSSSPLLYWYAGLMLTKNPLIHSYVKSLLVNSSMNVDCNQKLFGSVVARKSLSTDKKLCRFEPQEKFFKLYPCFESYIELNIGVRISMFLMKNWTCVSIGSKAILIYCLAYIIIGTVMFSNFLPWT